jgi:hypothetical protein
MGKHRTALARQAWIAIFAIMLTVLAPALNHLLPAAQAGEHDVELCTSTGVVVVSLDAAHGHAQPGDPRHDAGAGHCAYCGVHASTHAFLPPSTLVTAAPAGAALMPRRFYQSPRLLFAWTVAASRAPPSLA